MPDRESRKNKIAALRREQILAAAMEVFARRGFTAATIPEIAQAAGVAAGTIYIYYPSKRDLFVAVIESLVVNPLLDIFEKESGRDFSITLKDALQDRLKVFQSEVMTRLLSLVGEIQRDPELRDIFAAKLIRPFLNRMEAMYRPRIASGEFRQMDPSVVVRLVGSMMIGMNLLRILEGETSPFNRISPDQMAQEIMNFILYGLMNGKSEEGKIK